MISPIDTIPLASIPGFNPLVGDYLADRLKVDGLYAHPFTMEGLGQAIAARQQYATPRTILHETLLRQYTDTGLKAPVQQNIDALLADTTFTVTAAHQPCLLMGPSFNIYKIAAAINLATKLKTEYPQYQFVPVFWMGSEDHDADELNHTYINSTRIEWLMAEGEGGAFGRRKLDSLHSILAQATTLLGGAAADKVAQWMEQIGRFKNFAAYTRYIVDDLFGAHGLVVIDQDDAALKKVFAPVIADELTHSRSHALLQDTLTRIETHYTVQAKPREINLFLLGDNYRERIIKEADTYRINNRTEVFSSHELTALIDTAPQSFSPNVILRPLYQEMILPNIAFVGGAGEHSYWLQLKSIFEYYHVPYPVLAARPSFAMLSPSMEKKYLKVGIPLLDYFGDIESIVNTFVKSAMNQDSLLVEEKTTLDKLFDTITTKATAIDPTLTATVQGEKQRQLKALEAIEGKIIKAEKRKQEESLNQIRMVYSSLFPDSTWQERHDNILPLLQLDTDLIAQIIDIADGMSRSFSLLRISP